MTVPDCRQGDALPEWRLPITPTLVVSTAIATRDFQDVHHDRDLARSYGSEDIFVNILTSNGLVERYVTDWATDWATDWVTDGVTDGAGHAVDVRSIAIRLGAPAHPGDELVFSGSVASVEGRSVVVDVVGTVPRGAHVTGAVTIELPA